MGSSAHQCYFHIGERTAGKHSLVLFFQNVGKDQPLPVFVQHIFTAPALYRNAAAGFPRFHKMYFCIVAQRFKMPCPMDRSLYRLFVDNSTGIECRIDSKTLFDLMLQYFDLDIPHYLDLDLLIFFIPHNM